jgi:hypothetical protein
MTGDSVESTGEPPVLLEEWTARVDIGKLGTVATVDLIRVGAATAATDSDEAAARLETGISVKPDFANITESEMVEE